jgi:hypothetical protein
MYSEPLHWMEASGQSYPRGERAPGNHWIGGWVGPRAGLDSAEKRKISAFDNNSC